jgi:hypothetical protein
LKEALDLVLGADLGRARIELGGEGGGDEVVGEMFGEQRASAGDGSGRRGIDIVRRSTFFAFFAGGIWVGGGHSMEERPRGVGCPELRRRVEQGGLGLRGGVEEG